MAHTLPTQPITWPGPTGQLQAAWSQTADSKGAVLVIHENKGLTDWVRSVAGRLAGAGYSAMAIDLLSEQGGTAASPTRLRPPRRWARSRRNSSSTT